MFEVNGGTIHYAGVFEFVDTNGQLAMCDLVLCGYENGESLALVIERGDNAGKSIENDMVHLVNLLVEHFSLEPEQTDFISRFTRESYTPALPVGTPGYPIDAHAHITWSGRTATDVSFAPTRTFRVMAHLEVIDTFLTMLAGTVTNLIQTSNQD